MRRTKSGLPKHCGWNADQHGTRRVRFRKGGFSIYLTGIPWSEDFMRQYAAALEGIEARKANIGADRWPSASLGALISAYLDCSPKSSSPFKTLRPATQKMRRRMLDRWRRERGQLPLFRESGGRRVMLLARQHLQVMVNQKGATPFEQRNFLNTLRAMFRWALSEGRIPDDPTLGVTRPKAKTDGYRTWGDEEIERFEAHFPIGGKARLAFGVLLFLGQRRGDTVRMGEQHIRDGEMTITQEKTGTKVTILRSCARSSTRRPWSASRRSSSPIRASPTPPSDLATGFATSPTKRAVPAFRRMGCERRPRQGSPRSVAATSRSPPSLGTSPPPWSASTPAPPTKSASRGRRCAS